jgi:hypothetical protein
MPRVQKEDGAEALEPTHHCDYCNRDIIPDERDDEFGPTGDLYCPHCGAHGNATDFHVDEPWIKPLKDST